jgi:hypothetical protein
LALANGTRASTSTKKQTLGVFAANVFAAAVAATVAVNSKQIL